MHASGGARSRRQPALRHWSKLQGRRGSKFKNIPMIVSWNPSLVSTFQQSIINHGSFWSEGRSVDLQTRSMATIFSQWIVWIVDQWLAGLVKWIWNPTAMIQTSIPWIFMARTNPMSNTPSMIGCTRNAIKGQPSFWMHCRTLLKFCLAFLYLQEVNRVIKCS